MIFVTVPYLPKKKNFLKYLDSIYSTKQLTNSGPLVNLLTERLKTKLNVNNILPVCNATIGLTVAYKTFGITKKAITTPFSFVATSSSLAWTGIKPIYVDIDGLSWNMSTELLGYESFDDVECIVPVHVFGNPVNVDGLERLARAKKVKVIYDAAHAFGVVYKEKSLLSYGDASVVSFHATKSFHTGEGGAIVFSDDSAYEHAKSLINFGFEDGDVSAIGINAKMSEMHAALGLAVLDEYDDIESRRGELFNFYENRLRGHVTFQERLKQSSNNYTYFPILLEDEVQLKRVLHEMVKNGFLPRRYFHPSLQRISAIDSESAGLPVSDSISTRILCLPLFPDLKIATAKKIVDCLLRAL
jgi:dTDP-4-amino-4,6-dideoxygalactose transaminase